MKRLPLIVMLVLGLFATVGVNSFAADTGRKHHHHIHWPWHHHHK